MVSVASQLIEKVTVSRMRERYAQTIFTNRITYIHATATTVTVQPKNIIKGAERL
jgi:hypothetical protein